MKTVAIVHVFYPEIWPEIAACLGNLGEFDLVITYVDEKAIVGARRDFPKARFIKCENRGYDVWPFLKALQETDLGRYDLVVKLHTKRDVIFPHKVVVCNSWLNDSRWRDHLLAFVRTPEAWRRTLKRFAKSKVGIVADRHVIFARRDAVTEAHRTTFDRAMAELNGKWNMKVTSRDRFVGGTMFAARAELMRRFVEHGFSSEMFVASQGHDETYAHALERMLGLAVCGMGYRVVAFNGSVTMRRIRYALKKFLFDSRRSERRRSIRIFGITVYLKKLSAATD